MITERGINVFKAITDFIDKNGYSPSIRELCIVTGIKSSSTLHSYLIKLELEGYIKREKGCSRTINIIRNE